MASEKNFDIDTSAAAMCDRLKAARRVEIHRRDGETTVLADGDPVGLLTAVRLRKSPSGLVWGFFEFWGGKIAEREVDHLDVHLTHFEG